ncbi:hypothetical protein RIF29_28549 [Crotalaria pallida]|uniref:Uncharacterized protein n=1 Tax=Crotalaria pallida TaxID=3830 RepID=A0AAN9HWL9_CROPI
MPNVHAPMKEVQQSELEEEFDHGVTRRIIQEKSRKEVVGDSASYKNLLIKTIGSSPCDYIEVDDDDFLKNQLYKEENNDEHDENPIKNATQITYDMVDARMVEGEAPRADVDRTLPTSTTQEAETMQLHVARLGNDEKNERMMLAKKPFKKKE